MRDPLRVLSLFGCAAVGAILAYVFGVTQVVTRLESGSAVDSPRSSTVTKPITAGAWSTESLASESLDSPEPSVPEPSLRGAPNSQVAAETGRQISRSAAERWNEAAYPIDDVGSNRDRSSAFAVQQPKLSSVADPQLLSVPPVQMAAPVECGSSQPNTDQSIWDATFSATDSARHKSQAVASCGNDPDVTRFAATSIDDGELQQESTPYVVLSPEDSRPLLTLRLGRFESQQMSPDEMAQPLVTSARPVIRNQAPRASLFVDVDDRDLTCSIRAQHVKLRDLLTTLGERAGIWITTTQHVDGLVSVDIVETRLEEALEQIVVPLGYSVGVQGNAILVGLHDEIAGYDRRLSDFADYDQARNARLRADAYHPAEVYHRTEPYHGDSLRGVDSLREVESYRGNVILADTRFHPDPRIRLVSHDAELGMGSATAKFSSIVSDQPVLADSDQPADEIPMHANPVDQRELLTEEMLQARRSQLANEEENVVSIIAERALNLMRRGEHRRTVNMLSQLVVEHSQSAQLFQLLGEAYYHCEQFEAAEVSLNHSLQLYKNDPRTNYFMGCTLHVLGNRQRSLHYLLQAHDLDPMYPPVVSSKSLAPR